MTTNNNPSKGDAMTKKRKEKIRDEMMNMLIGCNGGFVPEVENEGDPNIPDAVGVEEWLNWVSAIRRRYANSEASRWAFVSSSLNIFLEFHDAHERICELIDNEIEAEKAKSP